MRGGQRLRLGLLRRDGRWRRVHRPLRRRVPGPDLGVCLYAGAGGDVVRPCVPPTRSPATPATTPRWPRPTSASTSRTEASAARTAPSAAARGVPLRRGLARRRRASAALSSVPESGFVATASTTTGTALARRGRRGVDCADDDDARFEGAPELATARRRLRRRGGRGLRSGHRRAPLRKLRNACEAARAEVACRRRLRDRLLRGGLDRHQRRLRGRSERVQPTNEGVSLRRGRQRLRRRGDEDFDLDSDPLNCRVCDNVCLIPQGEPAHGGRVSSPPAIPVGGPQRPGGRLRVRLVPRREDPAEVCDGVDNDRDGGIDNDIDLATSTSTAACARRAPRRTPRALAWRAAARRGLQRGLLRRGRALRDVLQYACTFLGASELCDDEDQDRDGRVDEGFTLATDEDNCGSCGASVLADAEEVCIDGVARCRRASETTRTATWSPRTAARWTSGATKTTAGVRRHVDLPNAFSRCDEGACVVTGCVGTAGLRRPGLQRVR